MRAKKKNKKRMDNMTKLLIPLAVAINMLAYTVLYSTTMLILGDSIGTILVGAICGPGPGAIVGLLSNLVNVIKNPVMIVMNASEYWIWSCFRLFDEKKNFY